MATSDEKPGRNRVEGITKLVGINMASQLPRDFGLSTLVEPTSTESGSHFSQEPVQTQFFLKFGIARLKQLFYYHYHG